MYLHPTSGPITIRWNPLGRAVVATGNHIYKRKKRKKVTI
nr:MAG TPA: hypothetical protein [Caudoviricetes sp.]